MAPTFQKATKEQAKLRCAAFGPSGSGKTFTALRVARGIVGPSGRIALIDTEHKTARKYADRFAFDVLELSENQTIDNYILGIKAAAQAGYDLLIIDSMTHGWQELLAEIDRLAKTKYSGNTWSAWSDGTPKQRAFVQALLGFPGHIIATMRSKTEWESTKDERGRIKPVRVGLAPDEGKGIEYEFDLLIELSTEHFGTIIKDRTGKFQDAIIEKPGEEFGEALAAWLADGAAPAPYQPPAQETTQPASQATQAPPQRQAPAPSQPSLPSPQNGTASRGVTFPFGKHKGKAPADLTADELSREYRFWCDQVNDPKGNPKFSGNNKRVMDACAEALKACEVPFTQETDLSQEAGQGAAQDPGTPGTVEQLLIRVQEIKDAKQLTSAKVVLAVRKAFGKALEECSAEELEALIGELQAI